MATPFVPPRSYDQTALATDASSNGSRIFTATYLDTEDRRNPYELTAVGAKALRARLASMQSVAKVGQRRLAKA